MLSCRIRSITPPGGVVGAAPSVEVLAGSAEPPPAQTLTSRLEGGLILSGEVPVGCAATKIVAVALARTSWADHESSWAVLPADLLEDEPDVLY